LCRDSFGNGVTEVKGYRCLKVWLFELEIRKTVEGSKPLSLMMEKKLVWWFLGMPTSKGMTFFFGGSIFRLTVQPIA
jgi:hypothetical protein